MTLRNTPLRDVKILQPKRHGDSRGWFAELFNTDTFVSLGLPHAFAQDNQSFSARGVLRGLHYQLGHPQGKLIRVLSGHIWDVAVDLRRHSPDFGRWAGFDLKPRNDDGELEMLWIPEGFAHGFLVLSETAEVLYRGIRSPVGGRTSFFASEKNFYRAPLPGAPEPKDSPPEGTAYLRAFASRVIYFELLYATPYTNTWSREVPAKRTDGTGESGPLAYWDSTRSILKSDGDAKGFSTFIDASSRGNGQDDILPTRLKLTLAIREADAAQSSTILLGAISPSATELTVQEGGRLEKEGGFVLVDQEWIEYEDVSGSRVRVKKRGARSTDATPHVGGAIVTVGRTFEAVIPMPCGREDWGDR